MSKERELLERAYQYIPLSSVTSEEIRDFLSTPEPTQDEEPVAWIREVDIDNPISALVRTQHECGDCNIPLYLHPAPRPDFVRLSEGEVNSLTCAPYEPYELICAVENRLVEKNRER